MYADDAVAYDELVSHEDVDARLTPAVLGPFDPAGRRVVEAGAGTGRITRLLSAEGAIVVASDLSPTMIGHTRDRGHELVAVADATSLPHPDACAGLAVAGWVFAHFRLWMPQGWRRHAAAAIAELRRVVEPGGRVVVVESLGSGVTRPAPPTPELGEFHRWLSVDQGLDVEIIATDYEFDSVDHAASVTSRFFGTEFGDLVRTRGWSRVPEFTGVWSTSRS